MDESNPDNQTVKPNQDQTPKDVSLSPDSEPTPVSPRPGDVITGRTDEPSVAPVSAPEPTEPGGPVTPAQPTVASSGGKKWLKVLVWLVVVAILAGGGWWLYQKYAKKTPAATTTAQAKDVPLIKVGFLQADFGELYPNMSVNDYSFSVNDQIFEGLVSYQNKSKIVPDLATKWSNPDSKTWVFTIRSGVKFHDGHTLAASDVKYSLDKLLAGKSDLAGTFADTIASVDVVNGSKVKITTTEPDPTLLNKLAFLYVIDANLPKGDEPSMAGTGPYEVKPGSKPSGTSFQLVAFDGYHGGKPTTRAVNFGTENDASALMKAFGEHKYDVVGYAPVKSAAQDYPNAKRFTTVASDVDFIGFNTVQPGPLQNKLVREAIRYAVNAQSIGNARGSEVTALSQMIPQSIPGYNPSIKPYKTDIAKAKQLLAQAGYAKGLTLRYSTSAGAPETTTEITNELKKVGITLTVDTHPDFDEFINYFSSGKAEMFLVDYSSDTLDGLDIYTTTIQSANYNNPKLTSLLDQASTTIDPQKRLKLLQDAAVIIDQDVATVPLSTEQDLWLMDKNYTLTQDLPSSYLPVYFYKVQQQ